MNWAGTNSTLFELVAADNGPKERRSIADNLRADLWALERRDREVAHVHATEALLDSMVYMSGDGRNKKIIAECTLLVVEGILR